MFRSSYGFPGNRPDVRDEVYRRMVLLVAADRLLSQYVVKLHPATNNKILAAVYGGIMLGVGLGIVFRGQRLEPAVRTSSARFLKPATATSALALPSSSWTSSSSLSPA